MRIDTTTGLHGTLIRYEALNANTGVAIVRCDAPVFESRPYSVHTISDFGHGYEASNGKYDLTWNEALTEFE